MILKVKKLDRDVVLPCYAHPGDAGMDLYCSEDFVLNPGESAKIKSGVALEIPDGYVGLVWDRSGLSINSSLKTLGGVIDSGYRGEVMVGMINLGKEKYIFKKGDKIAQVLIQKIERVQISEVSELGDSSRGEDGFGSTGK
jgi:dUTP pyrophosphatase